MPHLVHLHRPLASKVLEIDLDRSISCISRKGCPFLPASPRFRAALEWAHLAAAFPFYHPERSDPIFSSAPLFGESGRGARFVRPVRFAGAEGSLRLFSVSSAVEIPICESPPSG